MAKHSLVFNATSSQYVTMGNVLKIGSSPWALSFGCWVKSTYTGTTGQCIMGRDIFGPGQGRYGIYVNDTASPREAFIVEDNPNLITVTGTNTWNDNNWHFILVTGDIVNTGFSFYLDGTQIGTTQGPYPTDGVGDITTLGFLLGAAANSGQTGETGYFTGQIAQPFVYLHTLTSTQISQLSAGTLDPSTLAGASYWYGTEGSGTTIADGGNGFTGTLTNGVTWSTDIPTQLGGGASYTLTGPTSGQLNQASTNFTVTPSGGNYTGTITPHSTGTGTFSPTSLTWSGTSNAQTFTYTPTSASVNPHAISTTSSPQLGTDPPAINYSIVNVYTVQQADLWDNGYNNSTDNPPQSDLAWFEFTTNATSVVVTGNCTYVGGDNMGLIINGVIQSPLVFTTTGAASFTVSGLSGTSTIQLIAGTQLAGSPINGTFITSVTYATGSTFSVVPPTVGTRILFYGDSITVGAQSTYPETEGFVSLLRYTYNRRTMLEAWGGRALHDDASTGGLQTAFVNRLAGYTPSIVYFAIGVNDYNGAAWTASAFGTAYGQVLDLLHAALPNASIICQSPLNKSSEVANGQGNTLGDYRSAIVTACSTRWWARFVDGTQILALADLNDGEHPTTAGHLKYAGIVNAVLAVIDDLINPPSGAGRIIGSSLIMRGAGG